MEGYLSHGATGHKHKRQFYLPVYPAQGSSPLTATSAPIVLVPVSSALDIYGDVRTRITVVESNDGPSGVFTEHLLYNVTFTEITLNLS